MLPNKSKGRYTNSCIFSKSVRPVTTESRWYVPVLNFLALNGPNAWKMRTALIMWILEELSRDNLRCSVIINALPACRRDVMLRGVFTCTNTLLSYYQCTLADCTLHKCVNNTAYIKPLKICPFGSVDFDIILCLLHTKNIGTWKFSNSRHWFEFIMKPNREQLTNIFHCFVN